MKYTITTPPANRPVDWPTVKTHLRLDDTAQRDYVLALVDAATDYAQDALASSLMAQTITAVFYDGEEINLPRGPVTSVTSVTDADGNVVSASDYSVERVGHADYLVIDAPFAYPVTVVYVAGYASAAAVPASIRHAIMTHAATLNENRESVSDKGKQPVPHSLADFYRLKSRSSGVR